MDLTGDGKVDLISGSYDPGHLYVFKGNGAGEFGSTSSNTAMTNMLKDPRYKNQSIGGEIVVDKSGKPIVRKPDAKETIESFGSWVTTVDWDDDGDLDILLGCYTGEIMLRLNEGSKQKPAYATENIRLQVGGKIYLNPEHKCALAVGDWDGDGRWDLLVGSGNGAVYLLKNSGKKGAPLFAESEQIVPPCAHNGYDQFIESDAADTLGIRSQIALVDFNQDGKLDLLVGDFRTNIYPKDNLTAAQRKELAEIQSELLLVQEQLTKEYAASSKRLREAFKDLNPSEWLTDENQKRIRDFRTKDHERKEIKEPSERATKLGKRRLEFLKKPEKSRFNDDSTCHGYVWLLKRK